MANLPAPDARIIAFGAGDYPVGLCDLADAPAALHVLGGPLPALERAVAIVGARAATPYGLGMARRLAADLARLGIVVVSGLARGIDAAAHEGALEAGGRTVAVLPGGLDVIAPAHHAQLARRIRGSGALASEHPAGTRVFRGSFLERNRLIAALSAATVVVEAAERSGALSTATVARRLGRIVLAVPGDIDRATSRGCNALIRSGAGVCEGARDVLAALGEGVAGRGRGTGASSRPLGGASCAASLTPGLAPPIPGSREARSRPESPLVAPAPTQGASLDPSSSLSAPLSAPSLSEPSLAMLDAGPSDGPYEALSAQQWFHLACELESSSPREAVQAYHQALEIDPDFADAHVNLGRHYHEARDLEKAEAHYREAIRCAPVDATSHFNLGVLLEDRERRLDALAAYERALARDPELADAHYNLGLLCETLGRRAQAMRHLMLARRLYADSEGR